MLFRFVHDWIKPFQLFRCAIDRRTKGRKTHQSINQSNILNRFSPQALEISFQLTNDQMNEIVELLRGKLSAQNCAALQTREAFDVHARNVFATLIDAKMSKENDFLWLVQLRHYSEVRGFID